ncbi:MAG: RNase H family protein, partial [Dehalococcoidia bacterium]|nr:RNase H family protein [Dehalococcoidia bacterium]
MTNELVCQTCGKGFSLPADVRARYLGWTPRQCLGCRGGRKRQGSVNPELQRAEHSEAGPQTGIFTDGFCEPNPGHGGWGAVKVVEGKIVDQRHGHEQQTTNNRMELKAL